MANERETPRRPKPPTTIDLSATEVAVGRSDASSEPAADTAAQPDAAVGELNEHPRTQGAEPDMASAPTENIEAAPEPPPRARSAAWPLIGAAAGGAAIVLLALATLALTGVIRTRAPETSDVAAKLAQIETRLNARAEQPMLDPKALDQLAARITQIETSVPPPRPTTVDPALTNRLASLESATKALGDAIAALNQRTDSAVALVRESRERADNTAKALSEMTQSAAERQRATAVERSDVDQVADHVTVLENAARTVEQKVETTATAIDRVADRVTALENAKTAEQKVASTAAATDQKLRLAVLAEALKAAVARGAPYGAELAAVKPLVADPSPLAALEPLAATGVPSVAALSTELSALVPALARASQAPVRDGGFLDRVQANAERLVRIRPLGEQPGDDASALIARIEARAARADIPGALVELAKLPPAARMPAAAWIAKAEARAAAVSGAQQLAANALDAIGKP